MGPLSIKGRSCAFWTGMSKMPREPPSTSSCSSADPLIGLLFMNFALLIRIGTRRRSLQSRCSSSSFAGRHRMLWAPQGLFLRLDCIQTHTSYFAHHHAKQDRTDKVRCADLVPPPARLFAVCDIRASTASFIARMARSLSRQANVSKPHGGHSDARMQQARDKGDHLVSARPTRKLRFPS
jgi:hypothetical protein